MTYTAPSLDKLNHGVGTWPKVLRTELKNIETQLATDETALGKAGVKTQFLTAGMGTRTALATSGVDLASGSNAVYYGVFFAPVAITAVTLEILVNEIYAKNASTDAVVILKNNAGSPATIFTSTLDAAGVAAGTKISVTPQTGAAAITAGTRLDLYITSTGGSGTGYVDVILKYTVT